MLSSRPISKELFIGIDGITHLFAGGQSPMLRASQEALSEYCELKGQGMPGVERIYERYLETRELVARSNRPGFRGDSGLPWVSGGLGGRDRPRGARAARGVQRFRNPALFAKTAAAVDDISGERLVLGLGAGWNEIEYGAFGFPFDHWVARFEEAFLIVRTLLCEGAIDFSGTYYQVRDCELLPRVARAGRPPLLVGSTGERMLRAALPHVDAWNARYTETANRADGARSLSERVDSLCVELDRDPGSVERTVAVLVRPTFEGERPDMSPHDGVVPLSGTAEEIATSLLAYTAAGIGHVQLVLNPISPARIAALAPVLESLDRAEGFDRAARSS